MATIGIRFDDVAQRDRQARAVQKMRAEIERYHEAKRTPPHELQDAYMAAMRELRRQDEELRK